MNGAGLCPPQNFHSLHAVTSTTNFPDGDFTVLTRVMGAEYFRAVLSQFAPRHPFSVPVGKSQDAAAKVSDISWTTPLDVIG